MAKPDAMNRAHGQSGPASLSPGRVVELTVDAIGGRGDGIAKAADATIFIPQTAPGDRVRVTLDETARGVAAGASVELLHPGDGRAEPPCPHFGPCGGCLIQHLTPDVQSDWKRRLVAEALDRQGLGSAPVGPVIAVPPQSRRRVTMAARRGETRLFLGFNERASNRIVDVEACAVARPEIIAILPDLRQLLTGLLRRGETRDIAVTTLDDGLDLVLVGGPPPDLTAREALARFAERVDAARLSWRAAPGSQAEPIAHRRAGTVRLGGVPVTVPPGGFLQATAEAEAAMAEAVVSAVGDSARVADLFCGAGTLTFALARAASVVAVDGDGEAIEALRAGARQAGLDGRIQARGRNLYEDPLTESELRAFDAVVFDPPRPGARDQAGRLAAGGVPTVVAVSCNPASFARDARILTEGGYRLESITPIDQFLWSAHVELVAVFRRP